MTDQPTDDAFDSEPPDAPANGKTAKRTDLSNAEALRRLHGENLRYVGAWRKWLAWDGMRWVLDTDALALHYASETVRVLCQEALDECGRVNLAMKVEGVTAELQDAKKDADADLAHAVSSQNARKMTAALQVATSFREFATRHDDLDADPWILNTRSGSLDLRNGRLLPHLRTELATMVTGGTYDEDAKCPTWLAFLERTHGDAAMVSYLQRLVGYSLTGVIREHVLAFHFGGGANGKSTFLNTVHALLGDYAAPAHPRLIFRSASSDRHLTERATLFRKRFITCAETSEGVSFDEGTIKDLTGGDMIAARRMREDEWSFAPSHKLHLAGNERPIVRATDDGFWRRPHLIPWLITIPLEERDGQLAARLADESPGILAWAVRGCFEWQRNGLAPPARITEAVAEYRAVSDTFGQFLTSRCSLGDPHATCVRKTLRESYEEWCRELGHEPLGARRVAEALRRHGVAQCPIRVGTKVVDGWRGVALLGHA